MYDYGFKVVKRDFGLPFGAADKKPIFQRISSAYTDAAIDVAVSSQMPKVNECIRFYAAAPVVILIIESGYRAEPIHQAIQQVNTEIKQSTASS